MPVPRVLDGRKVSKITAFLFHAGGDDDPLPLRANSDRSSVGSYVLGPGFLFDDNSIDEGASSLEEMRRLTSREPRNAERIAPYLGGEELNTDPQQNPCRYVINFGEVSESEAGGAVV